MEKFKFILKKNLKRLPRESGVYCFKGKDEILYIGKAANIRERVKNHFKQPTFKDYLFLEKIEKIGYIKTNSEIEALILEAKLIKEIKPKFNVLWKDDKNYFFVGKTKENFPRIFWTHQTKIKPSQKIEVEYVGPFVDGKSLKKTLKILRKIFPFRSCKRIPKRPCLWYHLQRCPAPCLLKSKEGKSMDFEKKIKRESQRNAQMIMKILKEGKASVLKTLQKEMKKLAKEQRFEEAAKTRDQIEALKRVLEHAKIFEVEIKKSFDWEKISKFFQKIWKRKKKISRIEAFDVSNIRGKMATGSMVTFIEGVPQKNLYRKFKIKREGKIDDLSMLREVLERRFSHLEWGIPDLILIDGGKAHLNLAKKIKNKKRKTKRIKVFSLAKGKKEIFLEGKKSPFSLKDLHSEISNFILKLDREAHRFAITYHKKIREKFLFVDKK